MTTRCTEIAAIDAARNEAQVLAEGGVLGERRAARARLAMIVAFGLIAITTKQTSMVMMAMGTAYFAFAVGAVLVLHRVKASVEHARWRPVAVATLDTLFVGSQGVLSAYTGTTFQPAMSVPLRSGFSGRGRMKTLRNADRPSFICRPIRPVKRTASDESVKSTICFSSSQT